MKGDHLGEFEELVLLSVWALDDAYGARIQADLERHGRDAALGAIYAALDRLQRKGMVTSDLGDNGGPRGGRRKRHFQITGLGETTLRELRNRRERMWNRLAVIRPSLSP